MILEMLENAVNEIKNDLEYSIETASFNGKYYSNGQSAKEALIRSSRLILKIHEVAKISIFEEYRKHGITVSVNPPLGESKPEIRFFGLIKGKMQDLSFIPLDIPDENEIIRDGPLAGTINEMGKKKMERSLVVGIRSQLSSVDKNFDTLMERTFAETLNLRLRLPGLIMGEVYMLPVMEYDDNAMRENEIAWKERPVKVGKFINTFKAFSGRNHLSEDIFEVYKYERSSLVLVDFRQDPPKIYYSTQQLIEDEILPNNFRETFEDLSPMGFAEELVNIHVDCYF